MFTPKTVDSIVSNISKAISALSNLEGALRLSAASDMEQVQTLELLAAAKIEEAKRAQKIAGNLNKLLAQ